MPAGLPLEAGLRHIVGRSGCGKTTTAQRIADSAAKSERPTAYVSLESASWEQTLQQIADQWAAPVASPVSLSDVVSALPFGSRPVLIIDDYRFWSGPFDPDQLSAHLARHKNVTAITFSLPAAGLPNPVVLGPLPRGDYTDLSDQQARLTQGWAIGVKEMRTVLADEPDPNDVPTLFGQRMALRRQQRLARSRRGVGPAGRDYLEAMAELGDTARTRAVAEKLRRSRSSLGPTRASLLRAGIVFMPERGIITFACPYHRNWLLRQMTQATDG